MQNLRDIATGNKTYIAAALTVLGLIFAYLTGEIEQGTLVNGVTTAVLATFLRSGSKSDATAVVQNKAPD